MRLTAHNGWSTMLYLVSLRDGVMYSPPHCRAHVRLVYSGSLLGIVYPPMTITKWAINSINPSWINVYPSCITLKASLDTKLVEHIPRVIWGYTHYIIQHFNRSINMFFSNFNHYSLSMP